MNPWLPTIAETVVRLAQLAFYAYAVSSVKELLIRYVDRGNALLPEFRTPEEVKIDQERKG